MSQNCFNCREVEKCLLLEEEKKLTQAKWQHNERHKSDFSNSLASPELRLMLENRLRRDFSEDIKDLNSIYNKPG